MSGVEKQQDEEGLKGDQGQSPKKEQSSVSKYMDEIKNVQFFVFASLQIISMVCYGLFAEFDTDVMPSVTSEDGEIDIAALEKLLTVENPVRQYYPIYQDVHVMIFIGFGFLMTFLRRHMWSSVGFNFLIAAWTIQMSILLIGLWHCIFNDHWAKIQLNLVMLIEGDFAAGAVLISFGAVLGKVNPMQMLVMATMEIFFYALNFQIGTSKLKAVDMGGSMFVHTFGAYFGMAVSKVITPKTVKDHPKMHGGYYSQTLAMIGTLFLWMFWPSFNGALATGNSQHRVVVNTVLSLTASCMGAFLTSTLYNKGKFNMEDILNATLAGGVIIGSSSDLVVDAVYGIMIGFFGGFLSCVGFNRATPWLYEKLGIHDTCGVNNLHGLPGIAGGLIGAITACAAPDMVYGEDIGVVFPARMNGERSAGDQGSYQVACLVVTLVFSIFGGLLTGTVVEKFNQPQKQGDMFEDEVYWHGVDEGLDESKEK